MAHVLQLDVITESSKRFAIAGLGKGCCFLIRKKMWDRVTAVL